MQTLAMAAAAVGLAAATARAEAPAPPKPQVLADGVWLIPGGFPPKREPDGNTVVFAAPKGLIVLDTGRHPWHRAAIRAFAEGRRAPVAAIVNSHWHLDHTTGDAELRQAYPQAKLYASRAVEEALKGFLPRSAADSRQYLASGQADPETAEDLNSDIAAIQHPEALIPDAPIERSGKRSIAGKRLDVRLAANAATAGDVWLYDPATKVLASGDLVTLPAPLLDTACPAGWRTALDEIAAVRFRLLVPGHGRPLSPAEFRSYHVAFGDLIDCSAGVRSKEQCAAAWTQAVRPLIGADTSELQRAQQMTAYYVDLLRHNAGKSPYCARA